MKKNSKLYLTIVAALAALVAIMVFVEGRSISTNIQLFNAKKKSAPKKEAAIDWGQQRQRLVFATHGDEIVYKEKTDDNKWKVIYKDQESQAYDFIDNPTFSADGTQFAYSALLNNQGLVVVNNTQEIKAYDGASSITFTPDSQKVAFVAVNDGKSIVIYNGQESKAYDDIAFVKNSSGDSTQIIFTPDGNKVVYQAEQNGQTFVVINGQEGKHYDSISNLTISADGTQITYDAVIGGKEVTVVNGKETPRTEETTTTVPDNTNGNTSTNTPKGGGTSYGKNKNGTKDVNIGSDEIQITP